jgi:general secretion pathway protein G
MDVVGNAAVSQGAGRAERGFTLLELLVVIVIIGLLASLVAPRYFEQVGKSNTKVAKAQIDALEKALDQYRLDIGTYPNTEQGLAALNVKPQGVEKWAGPYLKKDLPNDPWGHPYLYKAPGEHGDYDIVSLGSDGQPGGTGDAADVESWAR